MDNGDTWTWPDNHGDAQLSTWSELESETCLYLDRGGLSQRAGPFGYSGYTHRRPAKLPSFRPWAGRARGGPQPKGW